MVYPVPGDAVEQDFTSQAAPIYLVGGFILLLKVELFFFRCITYICCIGIRQMSLLDLLSSLHDELGRIEAAKSHCAGDAAVQYLLHAVLESEPQLAQLVAVSLNARQPQLSPDTSSVEMLMHFDKKSTS